MPQVLVLGDDLTGSNATGARYARFGLRAVSVNAPLEPDAPCLRAESGIDALMVNLGTRDASPSHAATAVRTAIELAGPVERTVKRADTTLRGNVGVATEAVLASAPDARTLVVPAFPDAGRELLEAGHRVVGIRTRAPAPGTPVDPAVAARIPPALGEATRLILGTHRIGGRYATGGDIAVEITKAPGAEGFEIDAKVLPLAVAGRLSGGPHSGLPFRHEGRADRRPPPRPLSGSGWRSPPARGEASVVTVACLEHLNHVLATGRKHP